MATLNWNKRQTNRLLDAGYKSFPRVLDFVVDLSTDVTMTTATDDIQLGTLPGNTIVLAMSVQQVTPGTGSGTLVGRIGTTTATGTLASTAAAGTAPAVVVDIFPRVVPTAGEELNLLGATATRLDGKVRVIAVVVEGDRDPRQASRVVRDASL